MTQNNHVKASRSALSLPHGVCCFMPTCCRFSAARGDNSRLLQKKQLIDCCLCRFSLDFKRGQDIAFHFNPRFKEDHKRVIVCNSMFQNNWGKEERTAPRFPFEPGTPFKVTTKKRNKICYSHFLLHSPR